MPNLPELGARSKTGLHFQVEAQVVTISHYPESIADFKEIAKLICYEILPDLVAPDLGSASCTFFVTSQAPTQFDISLDDEDLNAPGFVLVLKAFPIDMLFYTAAGLKADLVIRLMERTAVDSATVLALWHPTGGLVAYGKDTGEDEYSPYPVDAVKHLLPGSMLDVANFQTPES